MITLQKQDDRYCAYYGEQYIGTIKLYNNPNHMCNCYLKLDMKCLDAAIGTGLFKEIKAIADRPLQVMVDSTDEATIAFLTAGGFVGKRRCYEVDASADEYIGGNANMQLFYTYASDMEYEQCCSMLFDYYVETHKAVNPWTADYETFRYSMPTDVVFAKQDGEIIALAFVEGNEIAYVCGIDKRIFEDFARCLVGAMFKRYETICFECDDCDWAAMTLKSMFIDQDETSFDTYILGDSL